MKLGLRQEPMIELKAFLDHEHGDYGLICRIVGQIWFIFWDVYDTMEEVEDRIREIQGNCPKDAVIVKRFYD